jgi:DNA-binding transcriptional regulator YdaS (Cro superfamily)
MVEVDPVERLRAHVEQSGSRSATAKRLGVTVQFLGDMLNGRRPVSARILKKLGLKRAIVEAA